MSAIGHKMSDRDSIALLADINEALDEDNEALKEELKRYKKVVECTKLLVRDVDAMEEVDEVVEGWLADTKEALKEIEEASQEE